MIEVLEDRTLLADGINPAPGPAITVAPGVALNNVVVATYTIANSAGEPGTQWRARVDWGDNTAQDKKVSPTALPDGSFEFLDSHTYATAGTYTVTVNIAVPGSHMPNDNTVTTTATVKALSSIAVSPTSPSVPKGETEPFHATGTFADGTTQDLTNEVTWASATTSVATISNTSGSIGLATALATGTSNITAVFNGVTGSTVLTVTPPVLLSIAVTPADPGLPKGETQQFTATGTLSDTTTEDLTGQVTWASATTSVATISGGGLATAKAIGTSSITATSNGVTGSTVLTVTAPALLSIAVTPADPGLPKGETQQFTATGTFSDTSTGDLTGQVTWASANTSVVTISGGGLATAKGEGTSSITATSNGVTGSTVLTVTAPVLQSIAVTPADPSLPKGETRQFTATGTLSDGTAEDLTGQVTWASATTTVATITAAGLATAKGEGTSSITATSDGVTGSTVLTVTAPALLSIAVTPADPGLPKGETQQFTATGTLSDTTTEDLTGQVTWASATTSVATISGGGLATAKAIGTSSITATSSGVTGSTVLTVTAPVLQSIAVTPGNPGLPKGETQQFTATGTLSDSSMEDLTTQVAWASATTSVATISGGGLATAKGEGTSSITATLNGIQGSTVLTVGPAILISIAVSPNQPDIIVGTKQQFTATGTLSDDSTEDLTGQVTWASATTSVATITTGGLATGVAVGTSAISATLDGVSDSTNLLVISAPLSSIAITPADPSVPKGETEPFIATGTFTDGSTLDVTGSVTWASATNAVATISNSAGSQGLATAVATGTSSISATLDGIVGSTVLTVTAPVLLSIAVTPADPGLPKGETRQFTATGTLSDGTTEDLTGQVTWASVTTSVATISGGGLATAQVIGTSSITATSNGVTGSTVLTVIAPVLQSIAVAPAGPSLPKGETRQFTATGTLSDHSTEDITGLVTWASATTSVATITGGGLATAEAQGTTSISAALDGISDSTALTVTAPVLQSIVVTPADPSLPKGETRQFTATGTLSDSTTENLTGLVTWASATTSVATITGAGLATAVGEGTASIGATLDGISGSTVLTVSPAVLLSIAVTPADPSIVSGTTEPFTATGTFSDQSVQDVTDQVTWASGATSVATVTATGLASGVAPGTSAISATFRGVIGSTVLTVSPAPLVSIAVTPANPSILAGETEPFTAIATFADHSTENVTTLVDWSSSFTAGATINSSGLATGVAAGTATIIATLDGVSGSTQITVTPSPSPSPIPSPSPTPNPAPTPAPVAVDHVSFAQNKKHQVTQITIGFGGALNAAEASLVATYRLAMPGKHGSFIARNAKLIRLKSASYDSTLDQVTLTTRKPFALKKPVQLLIHGSPPGGLQDGTGRFINGGGDAVFLLGRLGATVSSVAVGPAVSPRQVPKPAAVDVVLHQLGDGR